ncbi:unnamed protein product [Rotaria sordida]|uniref:Uncharacterized protein n=1 Tax=Rotaria sordida TaxID=392033 RepID=A0A819GY69_9BILA|nr:unnamed protein product [Rotaria sordida]CAF3889907.1 unnamed protein product [Rotaria sordida]
MTTDPLGLVAYGFSDFFIFSYTASTNTLVVHQNNSLSPSTSFLPLAVDYDGNRGIIAGFLNNGQSSRIKFRATVIMFSINAGTTFATPISSWIYPMNGTTWQAGQTNAGADLYAAKFDMSVSIDPTGTQVLVGIQSMNTVFLFSYTTTTLTFVSLIDNGQGIGFGGLFVILPSPSSYYSSTTGPSVQIVPAFSSQLPCIPGTYKNRTSLGRCLPCPTGTKNDGTNLTASTCVDCATNAFCPFGSTSDSISTDSLSNVIQVIAYPSSPAITGIDDILFFTLFSIGSTSRCVALSPLFWTLFVGCIVILIGSGMFIMKHCIKHPKAADSYEKLEKVFKQADLITAGDLWIGGLASFCIIVLSISCCVFSAYFYNSYPIETAPPSTYTCDTTLRNAQFSSSLQSLSIPVSDNVQDMFNLLNSQAVNLDVAFINTVYNCTSDAITLTYYSGTAWVPISSLPCTSSNYILSYSVPLPYRPITVQFTLPNIYTIGGLRVGLSGAGKNKTSKKSVQTLGFSQVFTQDGHMVGQNIYIVLQLTKLINDTSPLVSGDDDTFSAIWVEEFTVNYYQSFMASTDYLTATPKSSTNMTLIITETPYYILNLQTPIARLPLIIYHDFLFITMVIGMFALMFVLFKLIIIPFIVFLIRMCKPNYIKDNRVDVNSQVGLIDDDLENPTSNSNKQKSSKHKNNNSITDNVVPVQSQTFIENENANHDKDDSHQSPVVADVDTTKKRLDGLPPLVRVRTDGNRIIKEYINE